MDLILLYVTSALLSNHRTKVKAASPAKTHAPQSRGRVVIINLPSHTPGIFKIKMIPVLLHNHTTRVKCDASREPHLQKFQQAIECIRSTSLSKSNSFQNH